MEISWRRLEKLNTKHIQKLWEGDINDEFKEKYKTRKNFVEIGFQRTIQGKTIQKNMN